MPAALAGTDLVNYTVVAVENEVDFLCLLPALQCVQVRRRVRAHSVRLHACMPCERAAPCGRCVPPAPVARTASFVVTGPVRASRHTCTAAQAVGRLYQAAALAAARHLTDGLEDLFDVCVAPYFPLMFTPPKNNPGRISRPQLLGLVIGAMACCPQFAPLAVPLLSEKLGSSLQCVWLVRLVCSVRIVWLHAGGQGTGCMSALR